MDALIPHVFDRKCAQLLTRCATSNLPTAPTTLTTLPDIETETGTDRDTDRGQSDTYSHTHIYYTATATATAISTIRCMQRHTDMERCIDNRNSFTQPLLDAVNSCNFELDPFMQLTTHISQTAPHTILGFLSKSAAFVAIITILSHYI